MQLSVGCMFRSSMMRSSKKLKCHHISGSFNSSSSSGGGGSSSSSSSGSSCSGSSSGSNIMPHFGSNMGHEGVTGVYLFD